MRLNTASSPMWPSQERSGNVPAGPCWARCNGLKVKAPPPRVAETMWFVPSAAAEEATPVTYTELPPGFGKSLPSPGICQFVPLCRRDKYGDPLLIIGLQHELNVNVL